MSYHPSGRAQPRHRRAAFVGALLSLGACGGPGPGSTLDPVGPGAAQIAETWWVMLVGGTLILIGIVALGLYAALRDPDRRAQISPWTLIVGGGVVLPLVGTFALLVYGIRAGEALLPLPVEREVVRVEVIGHQFWWQVRYPDVEGGPLYAANQVHLPLGRPVDFHLTSEDVIHSFWVPRLGGKLDLIPGQENVLRLEGGEPGTFHGQCAEFCGAQHARMMFVAEVHADRGFEERLAQLVRTRPDEAHEQGAAAFAEHCALCHSVDPREPGAVGPNLAAVAQRPTLGAGTLANGPDALATWILHHERLKPGTNMPRMDHLDGETVESIVAFLMSARVDAGAEGSSR